MADKSVSFRLGVVGGDRARAEFASVGNAGRDAFRDIDRFSRSGSAGLQNVGFQVQDFAVQVGAGTSASQALAQQLPQLLSGFGLLGIALGTASAVLIPIAGYFFRAGEEAVSLEEKLNTLESAIKRLKDANENFDVSSLDRLIEKYGELDAAMVLMLSREQKLAESQAMAAARGLVESQGSALDDLIRQVNIYEQTQKRIAEAGADSAARGSREERLLEIVTALNDEYGMTVSKAQELSAAFDDFRGAESAAEMAQSTGVLVGLMSDTKLEATALYGELLSSQGALMELNAAGAGVRGWLGAAIDGAGDLAGQLWEAARAAFSVGQNQSAAAAARAAAQIAIDDGMVYSGRGGDPRQFMAGESGSFNRDFFEVPKPMGGGGRVRRSGGGGGVPRISDDEREAARIFDETRTAAEKYAIELKKLNDLKASGALDSDTYNRAMDALKDKTDETADAMKALESSVGEAFTSFVTGAKSGQEALADLLASLADTLANQAFQQIAGILFGGGGGGGKFLSAISGGGRAGGGPVLAGRSYMVGESGPEMVTMGGNGYVTSNAALRSAVGAGGGTVIQIDARGAVEGTAAMIAKAIQRAAPAIVKQSVAANRAAGARGY
jgi:hypothetical protein